LPVIVLCAVPALLTGALLLPVTGLGAGAGGGEGAGACDCATGGTVGASVAAAGAETGKEPEPPPPQPTRASAAAVAATALMSGFGQGSRGGCMGVDDVAISIDCKEIVCISSHSTTSSP